MNGKYRVLFLKKMFLKLTDSEHYLLMSMIIANLAKNGFSAGKRTIKEDIDALIYMGYDIEYIYNKGYHLKSRTFSLSVLKMLADAVASFRFLTVKDSEKLLKLLESLCSIYEAPLLRREIMLTNRVKSDNEQIFDNIDMINSALHNNQQISFDYYDYDINKQLVLRDGVKRTCSPFALVMCNEQYYVVSNYEKHGDTYTNFRIDRMRNIKLIDLYRNTPCEILNLEQYIKSSFSMFSGKSEYVTLCLPLENKYCNIVIDRFGKSVLMLRDKKSDNHFIIHVPVRSEYPQPFFSWIFSFRGKVEIISPIRLKERYTKVLYESCVQQYMN